MMTTRFKTALSLFVLFGWVATGKADSPPQWDRQQAQEHGWIYDDFDAGVAKSKETGKPMLVVLRCPP